MKQRVLNFIILLFCFAIFGNTANASLAHNSTLLMGPQSSHCLNDSGTPGACTDFEIPDSNYFAVDGIKANTITTYRDTDGVFSEDERIAIEAGIDGGIILGAIQNVGNIDSSWVLNGGTGYHYTRSPITIISDDHAGNVTLNMSGFTVWWEDEYTPLDFVAEVEGTLTCGSVCDNGDSFILEVRAILPVIDGFDHPEDYLFHMEGTISAVPVPAAVWLFGSGLLGLIGLARRKKA